MKLHAGSFAVLLAIALLGGCAAKVTPDIVRGYQPSQDIEVYCAQQGAKEGAAWIAQCTGEVSFDLRSRQFCQSCADKGGSFNECIRTAAELRASARQGTPEGKQPAIPLTCAKTSTSCMGYPDSATERTMKASRDSRAKVDMDSYQGAYCPKKPLAR